MTAVPVVASPTDPLPLGLWPRLMRGVLVALGWGMIGVGAVFALLPWHLGLPVLVAGLILVLRHSYGARRRFIRLQRRHPKIVFPLRRLLRREPEVFPVAWQQVLRLEKRLMPRSWRRARIIRRRIWKRRARHAAEA